MVFYFTGTGNSLYVAKQFDPKPISVPQVMRNKKREFFADSIGLVAPIYGHELPLMVKEFLKEADLQTNYFYIILTYGNRHGGAAELAKELCDSCGITVNYINVLLMVVNWLPSFDMDEQQKIDKKVEEQIAVIQTEIRAQKNMIAAVTEEDRNAHQQFLDNMKQMPPNAWQHLFRVTDACVGCKICEKVCPSASVRVINGKAVHTPGNCQTCLACAHACPQKAIQLVIPEKNPNARYRNEHISLNEIIESNSQK